MKVGDLVKGRGLFDGRLGIVLRVLFPAPVGDRYLLIQWNGGVLDTLNERLLEVINESR